MHARGWNRGPVLHVGLGFADSQIAARRKLTRGGYRKWLKLDNSEYRCQMERQDEIAGGICDAASACFTAAQFTSSGKAVRVISDLIVLSPTEHMDREALDSRCPRSGKKTPHTCEVSFEPPSRDLRKNQRRHGR